MEDSRISSQFSTLTPHSSFKLSICLCVRIFFEAHASAKHESSYTCKVLKKIVSSLCFLWHQLLSLSFFLSFFFFFFFFFFDSHLNWWQLLSTCKSYCQYTCCNVFPGSDGWWSHSPQWQPCQGQSLSAALLALLLQSLNVCSLSNSKTGWQIGPWHSHWSISAQVTNSHQYASQMLHLQVLVWELHILILQWRLSSRKEGNGVFCFLRLLYFWTTCYEVKLKKNENRNFISRFQVFRDCLRRRLKSDSQNHKIT